MADTSITIKYALSTSPTSTTQPEEGQTPVHLTCGDDLRAHPTASQQWFCSTCLKTGYLLLN
jgi:hypothetical protein